MHVLFIVCDLDGALAPADLDRVRDSVSRVPGLAKGLVFTPAASGGSHPFAGDGPGPALTLELDFASPAAREDAMSPDGGLAELGSLLGLAHARISHQAMTGRDFPVAGPSAGPAPCTFLVEYSGEAEDLAAWLDHYDAHHPPIMVRFPAIREVATYRPVEGWRSGLPFAQRAAMQRNKVVFDSVAALTAALASPVMDEMRADTAGFPPFSKRATHHAMDTLTLAPGG